MTADTDEHSNCAGRWCQLAWKKNREFSIGTLCLQLLWAAKQAGSIHPPPPWQTPLDPKDTSPALLLDPKGIYGACVVYYSSALVGISHFASSCKAGCVSWTSSFFFFFSFVLRLLSDSQRLHASLVASHLQHVLC